MSLSLIKYVLMASIRDRIITAFILMLLVTVSLSIFMGSSAVLEKLEFSLVFTSGSLRLIGVLTLILFAAFFIRRSFESRDVEFLLSRPISRTKFIISYSLALSLLAIGVGLAVSAAVYGLAPSLFGEAHILWMASIIVEGIIMVNVAFFFAMFLSSSATVTLATLAFYVLARMAGQFLGIVDAGIARKVAGGLEGAELGALETTMQFVTALLPRLDLMGQTSWLLYGYGDSQAGYLFLGMQLFIYLGIILSAALVDLVRRQF